MKNTFLHDISNVVAIIQGKIKQTDRILKSTLDAAATEAVQAKITDALRELERLVQLINQEKRKHEDNTKTQ